MSLYTAQSSNAVAGHAARKLKLSVRSPAAAAAASAARPATAHATSAAGRVSVRVGGLAQARRPRAGLRRLPCSAFASAAAAVESGESSSDAEEFTPVLALADLPKGSRKLVTAFGRSALLFWYRDKVYAVEPRSPASGAYSEGLETARFTQDGCIECPQTQTTFDLATGAIKSWYPTNPVLRMLTPQEVAGRPLEVFPVRTDASTISVAFDSSNLAALGLEGTSAAPTTSGGVETSAERNNVYGIEPRVYLQDGSDDPDQGTGARPGAKPAVIITGTLAVGIIAVAGTAVAISKESIPGLVIFWIALLVPVVYFIAKNAGEGGEDGK